MKYKLGDEVYLKGVITSINSCVEINYPYEVKTAGEFVTASEELLEPINKSELGHAEEAPRYLRNVLARLRELPEHDRKVWMDEIMHEFANDYGSVKYTLGYEQGKFDGAVEAGKSKVVIPQFVADWIDYCKENHFTITGAFDPVSEYGIGIAGTFKGSVYKCTRWALDNQNLFARAWLDGYEVEQEKRYVVTDGNHLYFKECQKDVEIVILADKMPGTMNYVKKFDSKDEAQKVADVLGWKVQEVKI